MAEDLSILTRKANPPDLTVAYGSGPDRWAIFATASAAHNCHWWC
jgi:hypothetical protein